MRDLSKTIDGRLTERPVNEKAVVVAHKSEGYYANSFEDAVVYDEGAAQLAFQLCRDAEGLCDDSDNDNDHADQCKAAGFGKLQDVSEIVTLGYREEVPLRCLDRERGGRKCRGSEGS